MASIILLGIESKLSDSLKSVLAVQKHRCESKGFDVPLEEILNADAIFAGADDEQYVPVLDFVKGHRPLLPVIAVTQTPNSARWLAALEAGATDFCSPPFTVREIDALMGSALQFRRAVNSQTVTRPPSVTKDSTAQLHALSAAVRPS